MKGRLEVIELYRGEEYPIEADFRSKCKGIGVNINSASHKVEPGGIISIGSSSVSANLVTVVITGLSVGCTVLETTGVTTPEGYSLIGKVEIHVVDPKTCSK